MKFDLNLSACARLARNPTSECPGSQSRLWSISDQNWSRAGNGREGGGIRTVYNRLSSGENDGYSSLLLGALLFSPPPHFLLLMGYDSVRLEIRESISLFETEAD